MFTKKIIALLHLPLSARQAARSTPKRIPSIAMQSPSACSSPGPEFPPGDQLDCLTLDLPSVKNVSAPWDFRQLELFTLTLNYIFCER